MFTNHFAAGGYVKPDTSDAADRSPWFVGNLIAPVGLDIAPIDHSAAGEDLAKFALGDVVELAIGGPRMVVIGNCECGTVEVAWLDSDGDICTDAFPEEALVIPGEPAMRDGIGVSSDASATADRLRASVRSMLSEL